MKKTVWKSVAVLMLTAAMLSSNAGALFGWGTKETVSPDAPTAEDITCRTYQGVTCYGRLRGGEKAISFILADEPGKGAVSLEGDRFIYTPRVSAAGRDRFTYTALDEAGSVSLPAVVEIEIEKSRSGVRYADLENSTAAAAAQHLAETGIFTGAKLGDCWYFEPDREVLRSEFLALALETAGREVTPVTLTGFSDDEAIPTWAKAYAAAGVAEGIVKGRVTEAGNAFRGEAAITIGEAATLLDRILCLEDVDLQVWYADRTAVPSWAAQAVANMESVQVLEAGSFGGVDPNAAVTRADAAKMLSAVKTLLDERK